MPWCCGESYRVNEDYCSPKHKRDHSFKAIISFMLIVLILFVVIYCLLVLVTKVRHDSSNAGLQTTTNKTKIDDNYHELDTSTNILITSSEEPSLLEHSTDSNLETAETLKSTEASTNERLNSDGTTELTHKNYSEINSKLVSEKEEQTTNGKSEEQTPKLTTTVEVSSSDGSSKESSTVRKTSDLYNSTTPKPTSTTTSSAHVGHTNPTTHTIEDQRNSTPISMRNWTTTSTEHSNLIDKALVDNMELLVSNSTNICEDFQCKEKVGDILQQMDHSVDSCEDFYQFACGRSTRKTMLSAKMKLLRKTLDNPPNNLQAEHFRRFVKSCVQFQYGFEYGYQEKIEQILSTNIRSNNLTVLLASLMARQTTPFFEVRFDLISTSEGFGLQLLPPSDFYNTAILQNWSIESEMKEYCMSISSITHAESNLKSAYEKYKSCVEKATIREMKDFLFITRNESKRIEHSNKGDDFPLNMKRIPDIDIQFALTNQRYTKTDIASLNKKYSSIDWGVFFNVMFHNKFKQSMPIYLYMQNSYFDDVMAELKNRLTNDEDEVLHKVKQFYQFQFYQSLVVSKPNPENFCIKQAQDLMPEITESIFAAEFHQTLAIDRVKTVFQLLKDKFVRLLTDGIIGMENHTKRYLKARLRNLKLSFFGSDWNNKKDPLPLPGNDYISYLLVSLDARRCLIDQPINPNLTFSQYEYPAVIPNSETVFVSNNFLYRILKDDQNPAYITELYLRFHLSRAIAGFLDEVTGRIDTSFWTEFKDSLRSNLEISEGSRNWNGQQITYNEDPGRWKKLVNASASELLADNLALQIAFDDFSSYAGNDRLPWIANDLTTKQQFFILIAQDYCQPLTLTEMAQKLYESPNIPNVFRVTTMMSNSKDFEATFKCARGSGMNPEEKTEIKTFKPQESFFLISK
uniref:Peptidase M13 N-terminal domain-containing protein n=3 Tax=Dendroctonus ponderosae TaxID=77166 RepID=A0AAR5Q720_DENPD